jgi:L-asparagine oxygenase
MNTVDSYTLAEPELVLSDAERDGLLDALLAVDANPYRHYEGFCAQVRRIGGSAVVPEGLRDYVKWRRTVLPASHPVGYLKNLPIDRDLPVFDFDEPVLSKYALKKTFVGEGILALFAELSGTPGIGYLNVNDGDVFQDIYPKRALAASQSQKALNGIYFHKDLANHFVRPDYVYMIGMRSSERNVVLTTFASNESVVGALAADQLEIARQARFYTPFDDLTKAGGNVDVGDADLHPLVVGASDLRLFENRTKGLDDEAQAVVDAAVAAAHRCKVAVNVQAGDFVITCNNHCVHAKEIVVAEDPEGLRTRWIIKTVNVDALSPHSSRMVDAVSYLVRG